MLPDDFSIHLAAFHSESLYHENVGFWSNVYGFEMNTVVKTILVDGHVMLVPAEDLISDACCIKVREEENLDDDRHISRSSRLWILTLVRTMTSPLRSRLPFAC